MSGQLAVVVRYPMACLICGIRWNVCSLPAFPAVATAMFSNVLSNLTQLDYSSPVICVALLLPQKTHILPLSQRTCLGKVLEAVFHL